MHRVARAACPVGEKAFPVGVVLEVMTVVSLLGG